MESIKSLVFNPNSQSDWNKYHVSDLLVECFGWMGFFLHQQRWSAEELANKLASKLSVHPKTAKELMRFWEWDGLINAGLEFRHQSFQEYAASSVLAKKWQDNQNETWEFLKSRLHHYAWREPILFMANQLTLEENVALLALIRNANSMSEEYVHRDLRLTVSIIANDGRLFTKFGKDLAEELTTMLCNPILTAEEKYWFTTSFRELGDQIVPHLERIINEEYKFTQGSKQWLVVEVIEQINPQIVSLATRKLIEELIENKRTRTIKILSRWIEDLECNDTQTEMGGEGHTVGESYTIIEPWPDEITTNDASELCREKRQMEQDWFSPLSKYNAFDYLELVVNRLDELGFSCT